MDNASPNASRVGVAFGWCWGCVGVVLGVQKVVLGKLGVALSPQGFLGTNMLVSATQKSRVGGIAHREPQTRAVSRCSGI